MTLRRQDRTAFAGALLAGYVTVFFALSAGISEFVAEQLTERNRADARDLAQRLAALPADDAALREWLAGEFSTGAYRYLALSGPRHVVFNERRMGPEDEPRSLADGLFPAHFVPGRATVRQDGVDPRTLIVELRPGPAMELQRSLVGSLAAVLGAGLAVSAVLGAVLVRRDPPSGDEGQGSATLADNREARPAADPDRDGLTGLLRRGDFLAQLKATLDDDERSHAGCLALLRIEHLAALNHSHGRRVVDAVLASIGQSLRCWIPDHGELISGRLNGSDFAVLAPACDDPARLGTTLRWRIAQTFKRHGFEESLSMPATATHCASGEAITELLTRLDSALAREPGQIARPAIVAGTDRDLERPGRREAQAWRERLEAALAQDAFYLQPRPVVDSYGFLLHEEGVLHLRDGDRCYAEAEILAWGDRLSLNGAIDRCTVALAKRRRLASGGDLSIALSAAALTDPGFAAWLRAELADLGSDAEGLAVEVDAAAAIDNPGGFATLRRALHHTGAGLGLRHVGQQLVQLDETAHLMPDYIKIDPLYVRGIAATPARRRVLKTLAAMARSHAIPCIAEGVATREEREAAFACGVTAAAGPAAVVQVAAGKHTGSRQQTG